MLGGLTLNHFLVLSLIIFAMGLYCVLSRRNAIGILMGVELILNSANINYLAFSLYGGGKYDGGGGSTGTLNFATESGPLTVASLTAGGALSDSGAAINLNGAGGVLLAANLGSAATGAISITGPLGGAGNIVLGAGALTLNQNSTSTYAGAITGNQAVIKSGSGVLTLGGTNTYTGGTTVAAGSLLVDGIVSGTSSVFGPGTIGGAGSLTAPAPIDAPLDPGDAGATGILNTGNLAFGGGGGLNVEINNASAPGAGYDQVNVTGTVALNGTPLNVLVTGTPTVGDTFTLIKNDGSDSVSGQFASGATVEGTDPTGTISYTFNINYHGGDGNDVVATLASVGAFPLLDIDQGVVNYEAGNGTNNDVTVSISGGKYDIHDAVGAINLTPASMAAGWTIVGGDAVGPTAGVTALSLQLGSGSDQIESVNAGTVPLSIAYTGSLTVNGSLCSPRRHIISVSGGGNPRPRAPSPRPTTSPSPPPATSPPARRRSCPATTWSSPPATASALSASRSSRMRHRSSPRPASAASRSRKTTARPSSPPRPAAATSRSPTPRAPSPLARPASAP